MLTLSALTFAIPCLDVRPSELSVNSPALVAGMKMDLSLSAVWAGESPKYTNFGFSMKTELLAKFTLSHGLTSATSTETISAPLTPQK